MGYVSGEMIERAGRYLLSILKDTPRIQYSEYFYDGSDAMHEQLMEALGLEDDWYSAEGLVDDAAGQLEIMGLVEITMLKETMADGEQDYVIALTDNGKKSAASGEIPSFRGIDH
jgi:hypothetical protein